MAGFAVAGASDKRSAGFGNHTLKGMYEFHADGVVEVDGVPTWAPDQGERLEVGGYADRA